VTKSPADAKAFGQASTDFDDFEEPPCSKGQLNVGRPRRFLEFWDGAVPEHLDPSHRVFPVLDAIRAKLLEELPNHLGRIGLRKRCQQSG
jgi:hypothetical protein